MLFNRTVVACLLSAAVAVTSFAQSDSALADRIEAGDRKAALEMIGRNSPVNTSQPDGTTPLHWAVYRVDEELVKALLARGAKADIVNAYGSSPLAEAVRVANASLAGMLLDAGADANRANEDGETPVMLAARTGAVKVAELLVRHGANVNARERFRDQTALMWAAAESHQDMVAFLISKGAGVNLRAKANDWPNQMTSEPRVQYRPTGGLTPLLYAARGGCQGCIEALLKGGADIDLPNPDGMTPLMMAIDNSHYEVARYLLDHGANPHTWDWWGRTPLYVVVNMRGGADSNPGRREPASLDLVGALLNASVNPNHQLNMLQPGRNGNSGRFKDDLLNTGATPLLRAAQTFDNEVVRALLDHRALVDLPNAMGVTPLMAAAGIGTRTGQSVLGPGPPADVEARSMETMGILIKAGADVNARITDTTSLTARIARASTMTNREGQTALFFAAQSGRAAVVRFLLDHGADVNAMGDSGRTLLNAARANAEVTALIRAAMPKDAGVDLNPLPR
ncbi:MAG TPA: ankyrin repeat domain-containing protein [Terriglobia bacterium]|nr:ankyrin repeat domain-containing protein [Terriglobia bacterium]